MRDLRRRAAFLDEPDLRSAADRSLRRGGGVIAAYIILHPKVKVWVLALWRIPIRITAAWALGIWIAAQFGNLLFESEESVAWWAHIGGLWPERC